MYHGNGGYDWNTVYDMPLWLRKFTWNQIKKYHDDQAAAQDISNNILTANTDLKKLPRPNIPNNIDYNVKKSNIYNKDKVNNGGQSR